MKNFVLIILLALSFNSYSQSFLNKYKYVIVDSKYDFVISPDQYETSSLTKFLFNKIGLKAFLETDEIPEELSKAPCQALFVSVRRLRSLLRIKTEILLKDCIGKVIHTSDVGITRTKEFERGYYQSISRAFTSIERLNYKYDETLVVKTPDKQVETVKKPLIEKKLEPKKKIQVVKELKTKSTTKPNFTLLYAQENKDGFQLVSTKPEVVFVILKTSKENLFIIKDKNGILEKKENFWVAQYYEKGKFIIEKYQIKF